MLRKKFVIVEDNALTASMLTEIIESHSGWTVVGTAGDAAGGTELIADTRPDIVILDLILGCGRDGFSVMESVRGKDIGCKFFVLSGCGDENMIAKALSMGASYYLKKPYEADILIERLQDLVCETAVPRARTSRAYCSALAEWERRVANFIYDLFVAINMPASQNGFVYLLAALKLARHSPSLLMNISGRLYPAVGKMFGVSDCVVERCLRKTIETTWERQHTDEYYKIVKSADRNKPTNGELLRHLTDYSLMMFPKPEAVAYAENKYHSSLICAE